MYGSFMRSSGKGASIMKLPLSDTTGPAFAFAMRRVAFGEPMRWRFCRIFVYAKGTTSIGTPCFHCSPCELKPVPGCVVTESSHVCTKHVGVLAVVRDENEAVGN